MNKTHRIVRTTVAAAIAVLSASSACAGLITGVTASTNMGSSSGTNLQNTVNGVGLSALALNATHQGTSTTNSWASASGVRVGQITFDLGGLFDLDGFSFWNQNAGGPGPLGSTGLNRVEVSTSTDGLSFAPWFASEFARVTTAPAGPQVFDPTDVTAGYVRFNVLSNHGDPERSGFAEVQFDGTAVVPVPGTIALLGFGLAGLAFTRRRKR